MKFLIWLGAFIGYFVAGLILDIIFMALFNGVRPGFLFDVALIFLMGYLGKTMCAKLDIKEFEKIATAKGMTPGEYASTVFSPSILDLCESNKNNNALFEKLMGQLVEGEAISKSDANVLRYMFCRKYGK